MAELTGTKSQQIDQLLSRLIEAWAELPEIAAEFEDWDSASQIDFIAEWPHTMSLLHQLERLMAAEPVLPEQQARYAELQDLIVKYQPLLEQIYGPG